MVARKLLLTVCVLLLAAASVPAAPRAKRTPPLAWVFQMHRDRRGDPLTDVFLRVGGRPTLVLRQAGDEFRVAAKADYKNDGVPAQALAACEGWWGGGGDNLYVVRRGRLLVVCRKEIDEEAPEQPWKRLKVIPLR